MQKTTLQRTAGELEERLHDVINPNQTLLQNTLQNIDLDGLKSHLTELETLLLSMSQSYKQTVKEIDNNLNSCTNQYPDLRAAISMYKLAKEINDKFISFLLPSEESMTDDALGKWAEQWSDYNGSILPQNLYVPISAFIEIKQGVCRHKALVTSLYLGFYFINGHKASSQQGNRFVEQILTFIMIPAK